MLMGFLLTVGGRRRDFSWTLALACHLAGSWRPVAASPMFLVPAGTGNCSQCSVLYVWCARIDMQGTAASPPIFKAEVSPGQSYLRFGYR